MVEQIPLHHGPDPGGRVTTPQHFRERLSTSSQLRDTTIAWSFRQWIIEADVEMVGGQPRSGIPDNDLSMHIAARTFFLLLEIQRKVAEACGHWGCSPEFGL
jgi:hypothetical protein